MNLPKIITREESEFGCIKPYVAKVIFTPEECKAILEKILGIIEPEREYIPGEGGKNSCRYDILIDDFPEVYDRIYNFILEANRENFGFDEDFVLSEPVYLNEYKGAEYCGWHTDGFISDGPRYLHRKLTCVVQFTEPEEYTGGDFELFAYHQIKENIKPIGTAYIIPAFEWHQVTPILSGTRRSMIMFLEGKERFR